MTSDEPSREEVAAELMRTRERAAVLEAELRRGNPQDMGLAGRLSITRYKDEDAPSAQAIAENTASVYERFGYRAARLYAAGSATRALKALSLRTPLTGELVVARHNIARMLSPVEFSGFLRRGSEAVVEYASGVNVAYFEPGVQAIFEHSIETPPGLLPPTQPGRRR